MPTFDWDWIKLNLAQKFIFMTHAIVWQQDWQNERFANNMACVKSLTSGKHHAVFVQGCSICMVLTDKQQFLDCIHYDEGGEYYARYNGLTLRSVFQPIFDKQHQVVGAEALVRIFTQHHTQIRPDLFFHSETFADDDKLNVERLSRAIHIRNFSLSPYRDTRLFLNVLPVLRWAICLLWYQLYLACHSTGRA